MKIERIFAYVIFLITGFLIFTWFDWKLFLVIFFWTWSNNIDLSRSSRSEKKTKRSKFRELLDQKMKDEKQSN